MRYFLLIGGCLEARDTALRSHGPPLTGRHEAHRVISAVIEELPRPATIARHVGPGSARNDPELSTGQPRDGRSEAFRTPALWSSPGAAAVDCECDDLAVFLVLGIIAAHSDAVPPIGKGQGENAGGRTIVANRRSRNRPGASAIVRME